MSGNSTILESYDANNDMTAYVDADANTTSWQYNVLGQETEECSPIGNTTTVCNAAGLAETVVDAGRPDDPLRLRWRWQHDDGNLDHGRHNRRDREIQLRFSGQHDLCGNSAGAYSYTDDDLGQKTQQIWTDSDGDNLTIDYAYDSTGNLTQETDSQGNTTNYTYNDDGLIPSEIVTSSTGAVARSEFEVCFLLRNPASTPTSQQYLRAGSKVVLARDLHWEISAILP